MYRVTLESFDSLAALWADSTNGLSWSSVFVLPPWLSVWWREFGAGSDAYLAAVRDGDRIVGIAPLKINGTEASIVGSENVCDYVDFIVVPGLEDVFFNVILDNLRQKGLKSLNLGLVRPDSLAMTKLAALATARGCQVSVTPEDVSFEMDLSGTWEGYLGQLNTKQRHEVRRKLRRLAEAGRFEYHFMDGSQGLGGALDDFMRLFALARDEKARFMTDGMEAYFRSLTAAMAGIGALRLGALDLDGRRVAMIMCFDYNDCVFLYNSGFDPQFESLSVGLLSKVLAIQESITRGRRKFDFLKGGEVYKERLGGHEIPLHRCHIVIG